MTHQSFLCLHRVLYLLQLRVLLVLQISRQLSFLFTLLGFECLLAGSLVVDQLLFVLVRVLSDLLGHLVDDLCGFAVTLGRLRGK